MSSATYRNARQSLIGELQHMLQYGAERASRNGKVLEVLGRTIEIERPYERFLLLNQRNDNPVAKIAETMWVLVGRNDVNYLSHYLPRARDYSDDDLVWRGGYGPRLRRWFRYGTKGSVDQVAECVKLLRQDPDTRRAVMVIYDPAIDFCDSKDIPCNNWIQWIIRDGKLHMFVTIRSNDLLWGFSGINAFEWSMLQQLMACWLHVEVGTYRQFVGSLHLYEPHFERAKRVLDAYNGYEPYDNPLYSYPDFNHTFEQFDSLLQRWFFIELKSRNNYHADDVADNLEAAMALPDLHMRELAYAIIAANAVETHPDAAFTALSLMPESAISTSLWEYFLRNHKGFAERYAHAHMVPKVLSNIAAKPEPKVVTFQTVCDALRMLEYKKTLRYGDSWRKHGEVLSIFANISRKYDRLEKMITTGIEGTADESIVDTWADLAVYCLKYAGYIGEVYDHSLPSSFAEALQFVDGYHYEFGDTAYCYDKLEQILTSNTAYDHDINKYYMTMQIANLCINAIIMHNDVAPQTVQKWLASVEAL